MSGPPLTVANFLAPNMTATYAWIAEQLGTAVGRPTRLVEPDERLLADGRIDVAFLCGLPYIILAARQPSPIRAVAAPVVDEPRCAGRPVYFSDVVVRRDSPVRTFADLRGRTWAHSQETSFSGCVATRHHLLQLGKTEALFGQVVYSGSHQASIAAVLAGKVEASAIDSHVLAVETRERPRLANELRVIESIGPSTIPPVVVSVRLPAEARQAVLDALCSLDQLPGGGKRLDGGVIQRFMAIDDRAYDDIRSKVALVTAAETRRGSAPARDLRIQ